MIALVPNNAIVFPCPQVVLNCIDPNAGLAAETPP